MIWRLYNIQRLLTANEPLQKPEGKTDEKCCEDDCNEVWPFSLRFTIQLESSCQKKIINWTCRKSCSLPAPVWSYALNVSFYPFYGGGVKKELVINVFHVIIMLHTVFPSAPIVPDWVHTWGPNWQPWKAADRHPHSNITLYKPVSTVTDHYSIILTRDQRPGAGM